MLRIVGLSNDVQKGTPSRGAGQIAGLEEGMRRRNYINDFFVNVMVALGHEHGWVGIPPTHLRLRDVDHFNPALRILARGCSEPHGAQSGAPRVSRIMIAEILFNKIT